MAGMPGSMIAGAGGGETLAASLHCCLFTRAALEPISGPNPVAATKRGEETGLFIQLREFGVTMHWLPVAHVFAAEDTPRVAEEQAVGELVDGWCLRARLTARE